MRSSPPRQRAGNQVHAPEGPSPTGREPRALWASLAIILILSLIGYGHLLAPGELPYSRYSDFVAYHLSAKTVLYDSLRQGRLPFWRSDQLSGYVALTNPQCAYTCPLHFLFMLLPPVAALGPTDYLHFLAAGGAFYALGAVLGLGPWPRVFLAAAGMFNFKLLMAVFVEWLAVVPTIVWMPALLAAVIFVVRRPGPAGAVAVAVTGALCLHAGQVQLVYYLAWFLVAYGLIELGRLARRQQWRALVRTVLWSGAGAALAVGLSTILLLPLAADGKLCSRAATSSLAFFLRPMSPRVLLTFLTPEVLGTPLTNTYPARELWEDVAYFGIIPLVLAAVAVVRGWRRRPVIFLAAALAICTVMAFDTPWLRWAYEHLPGFKLFRIPGRLLFVGSIFGLALAGIGLDELLAILGRRGAVGRRWAGLIVTVAIVIVTAEGTYYARRYLTMAPHAEALPQAGYRDFFAADRSLYRVASLERFTINAGWAAPMGVQLVGGYDSYNYGHYYVYFNLMATGQVVPPRAKVWFELDIPARLDLLDALNVKYLIAPGPLDVAGTALEPATVLPDQPMFFLYSGVMHQPMFIYRNTRCLDRAWWAGELAMAASEDDMADEVFRSDLHARTVVLAPSEGAMVNQPSPGDGLTIASWAPGRMTLRTHTGAPRFLVVSEVWNPAWRVRIDGRTAKKFQTNISLIGLVVPAGDHEVTLEFVPPHWSAACGITIASAAAVVVLGALAVVGRVKARRTSQPGQPGGDSISRQ